MLCNCRFMASVHWENYGVSKIKVHGPGSLNPTISSQQPVATFIIRVLSWSIWVFPRIGVPPDHPILIGFSIINHPFWGTPIFGNTHMSFNVLLKNRESSISINIVTWSHGLMHQEFNHVYAPWFFLSLMFFFIFVRKPATWKSFFEMVSCQKKRSNTHIYIV